MTKLSFLPLIFFSIFLNTDLNSQSTPILSEEIIQDAFGSDFFITIRISYTYDPNGQISQETTKHLNRDGEVEYQEGLFFEYDDKGRLIKKATKRYNPDVDLWISKHFIEYTYDDNDCLINRTYNENVGGSFSNTYYEVNENCQRIFSIDSSSFFFDKTTYEYLDQNNSSIEYRKRLDNSIWVNFITRTNLYNERGDLTKYSSIIYSQTNPSDTALMFSSEYSYEYEENPLTGLIDITYINEHVNNNSNEAFLEYKTKYEYSCEGLIFKESNFTNLTSEIPHRITTYTYENENPCFDFDQDLSLEIFPNPSTGEVILNSTLLESGNTLLRIFNIEGKQMWEEKLISRNHQQRFSFDFLNNGMYFIQLINGENISISKLNMLK